MNVFNAIGHLAPAIVLWVILIGLFAVHQVAIAKDIVDADDWSDAFDDDWNNVPFTVLGIFIALINAIFGSVAINTIDGVSIGWGAANGLASVGAVALYALATYGADWRWSTARKWADRKKETEK